MGCCSGLCKILMLFWMVIGLIFSMAMIGFMAFKLSQFSKQEDDPLYFHDLLALLPGSGWYADLNFVKLTKLTWYAAIGLATLMFIAAIIHVTSTCKKSRCLLGLSSLLLVLTLTADIAGLVFRFQVQDSIVAGLEESLNNTIVNQYGNTDHKAITESWNLLGEKGQCCGINSGEDFQYALNWDGEIKENTAPCGKNVETGCMKIFQDLFITIDDIWFSTLIGVKCLIMKVMLMHTLCVCVLGFHKDEEGSGDTESYIVVESRKR